jgi:hypothetical protein
MSFIRQSHENRNCVKQRDEQTKIASIKTCEFILFETQTEITEKN